jgi:hypothetical protein
MEAMNEKMHLAEKQILIAFLMDKEWQQIHNSTGNELSCTHPSNPKQKPQLSYIMAGTTKKAAPKAKRGGKVAPPKKRKRGPPSKKDAEEEDRDSSSEGEKGREHESIEEEKSTRPRLTRKATESSPYKSETKKRGVERQRHESDDDDDEDSEDESEEDVRSGGEALLDLATGNGGRAKKRTRKFLQYDQDSQENKIEKEIASTHGEGPFTIKEVAAMVKEERVELVKLRKDYKKQQQVTKQMEKQAGNEKRRMRMETKLKRAVAEMSTRYFYPTMVVRDYRFGCVCVTPWKIA